MKTALCRICKSEIAYRGSRPREFCSISCKAEWQRQQKPATKEWLYQKYIVEGLNCTEIAKIVNRDSKGVWNWLKGYGIPTRPRGGHTSPGAFKKGQPSAFRGRKLTEEHKQAVREARQKDGRIPALINGKHWLHVYTDRKPASWKGGITPERQVLYASAEWKEAVKTVWERDNGICQRCNLDARSVHGKKLRSRTFCIHHKISFMCKEERVNTANLVLLCRPCHLWVHSNANVGKEFLDDDKSARSKNH